MSQKEIGADTSTIGAIRMLGRSTIILNKMFIPAILGGAVVVVPYALLIAWVTEAASAWGGPAIEAATLAAILLLTSAPVALIMAAVVSKVEGLLPWNAFD